MDLLERIQHCAEWSTLLKCILYLVTIQMKLKLWYCLFLDDFKGSFLVQAWLLDSELEVKHTSRI